jgi:ubiquinone biosynthesis protein
MHPVQTLRKYRRLQRYRQVSFVLFKYGFEDIVERLGASPFWQRFRKRRAAETTPTPVRLRQAIAELGPTFVKFGQLLSTRPDLLPEPYITELARLQDQVSPFPTVEAERLLQEELNRPSHVLFEYFSPRPLASGSIAQVHEARLPDGKRVAVKIQRPGIHRVIESDLAILEELANLVEKHLPEFRLLQPRNLLDQFARTIRRELDFVAEAQAMECFRRNFAGDPTRFIPAVDWRYTTNRILVTDFVEGVKLTDLEGLRRKGLDPKIVARNGTRALLREVFEHRYFHADPHPGNHFVLDNHVIATVDFGMVGRLDDPTADALADLVTALLSQDLDGILRAFRKLGVFHDKVDLKAFRFDLQDFLDRYYGLPLDRLNADRVMTDLLRVIRRHRIVLPVDLALLGRMVSVASGVGRVLDPEFNISTEAKPFILRFLRRQLGPRRRVQELKTAWRDVQELVRDLPSDVETILAKVKKGEMVISLHHEGLNRLILEIDRSSNRVAFALIVAALIIGSSFVMQLQAGPRFLGLPAVGLAGYLIAGLLGLWLVLAIVRSGRI